MAQPIERIGIKGFRSIGDVTLDLDNPTILVGRNGAGKSNLVDALSFVAEAMVLPLEAVFDRRSGVFAVVHRHASATPGGWPGPGMRIDFGPVQPGIRSATYAFEIGPAKDRAFQVMAEQCVVYPHDGPVSWFERKQGSIRTNLGVEPSIDSSALALPLIGGDTRVNPVLRALTGVRAYNINPSLMRDMQDPEGAVGLRTDGRNSASVLRDIERQSPESLERIVRFLSSMVPELSHVGVRSYRNRLGLVFQQEWELPASGRREGMEFDALYMSDGTLRALGLLLAAYQRPAPTVLIVEEPEMSIHPGALETLLDVFHAAARRMQVVVTTHSPELLDAEWVEDRHIRVVSWQAGATRVTPLDEPDREALRQHLMGAGELLRANALQPTSPPVGSVPLFAELP